MFKIVSSKNYKKLQDELNGLHSVNSEKSIKIDTLEIYVKSLENTIKQRGEKVQAMREQIDAMRAVSKRRERKIEEIETELKLLNAALSRKTEEVLKLTEEKSRMRTQLKDSMAEITRLSAFTAPAETTEQIPNAMKSVEMPNIEAKSDAVQKPAKRKYFRSGKFKKQK
jgi:chromosome segregation ATPase